MFRQLFAILICTAVGASVGYFGQQQQPTVWKAQAQFEPPKSTELGNYFNLYSTFNLVGGNAAALDMAKLEEQVAQESYSQFKRKIADTQAFTPIFANNPTVQEQSKFENRTPTDISQSLMASVKFNEATNELSLEAPQAAFANTLMGDYIRAANKQVKDGLNGDLIAKWQALFQQVKTAADAKIDATWANKLKMMQSVQPLDDKLVAFRFVKMPTITAVKPDLTRWVGLGAGTGLMLGLLMCLIFWQPRREARE